MALEGQKVVNRRDGVPVTRSDPDFCAARAIEGSIADCGAPSRHDCGARHDVCMHLARLGEIAGLEGSGDVAHVLADSGDASTVGCSVAVEHDPPTVGQVLEDVC